MAGTDEREGALELRGRDGPTLVPNDVVGNIRDEHGLGGWMLRRKGFAGDEPHVPGPVKFAMIESKPALREQLLRWADAPKLKRILVAHGDAIEETRAARSATWRRRWHRLRAGLEIQRRTSRVSGTNRTGITIR